MNLHSAPYITSHTYLIRSSTVWASSNPQTTHQRSQRLPNPLNQKRGVCHTDSRRSRNEDTCSANLELGQEKRRAKRAEPQAEEQCLKQVRWQAIANNAVASGREEKAWGSREEDFVRAVTEQEVEAAMARERRAREEKAPTKK
jgi:hypothetical protein